MNESKIDISAAIKKNLWGHVSKTFLKAEKVLNSSKDVSEEARIFATKGTAQAKKVMDFAFKRKDCFSTLNRITGLPIFQRAAVASLEEASRILDDELTKGAERHLKFVDWEKQLKVMREDLNYHADEHSLLTRKPRSQPNRHERKRGFEIKSEGTSVISPSLSEASENIKIHPYHGGKGDGNFYVNDGPAIGTRSREDQTLVHRTYFEISNVDTRYVYSPPTQYYKSSTGEEAVAPGFERIVTKTNRGIVVMDPSTGVLSDIKPEDQFATELHTGVALSLDIVSGKHNMREENPIINELSTTALDRASSLLSSGASKPSVFVDRASALNTTLANLR